MAKKESMQKIAAEEISLFCDEIAMMLGAGMQLYDGVAALAETYANTPQASLYQQVSEHMLATGSLYEALKQDARWPAHMVEMAGIGEQTGRLDAVMKGLAAYYRRETRVRDTIISAITYPLVLAVMLLVIVLIMVVTVLPVFNRLLDSMGVGLTSAGSAMTHLGQAVGGVVFVLVGIVVLAVLAFVLMIKFGNRQRAEAWLGKCFAPMRRMRECLSASRVFSVLSLMVSSGFAMDEALRMAVPVLEDASSIERVQGISAEMEAGTSFGDALEHARILDPIHTRMVRMAVSIGREDEVMANIAETYEQRLEDDISNLVSIIEPSLVAMLCLVIGAILLSVMLPMAGIITSII